MPTFQTNLSGRVLSTAKSNLFLLLYGAGIFSLTSVAQAQSAAEAGSLFNQLQRNLPAPKLPDVGPPPPAPAVEIAMPRGQKITVNYFTYSGVTLVDTFDLDQALAGYLDRPLTFDELRNAAAEISLLYRKQGYVASASIPRQEIKDGIVNFIVNESRFGKLIIDPASKGRINEKVIKGIVGSAIKSGDKTDIRALDRAILLSGDVPGASVSGGLATGTEKGHSDLVLLSNDTNTFRGSLTLDNSGTLSTGEFRAIASATADSPWGFGEQFSVNGLRSDGLRFGQISTSIPMGYSGGRTTVSANRMNYDLTSDEYASANLNGQTSSWSIDYRHPVIRSRVFNLYFTAGYVEKTFENLAASTVASEYESKVYSLGLSANLYDDLFGGGVNSAQVVWNSGDLDLEGSPNRAAIASTTKTEGRFRKLEMSISREQNLASDITLLASVRGQLASRNLDSSERFFAGGAGAVRAYPNSEGAGDAGYISTLEARWQFAQKWRLVAFVDHSRLKVNQENDIVGAAPVNYLNYEGGGLGLNWVGPRDSIWRLSWARRFGDNPNPKANGSDQDGSQDLNRVWLSVDMNF